MKSFKFSREGFEEAKAYRPWYLKKQNYILGVMGIAYMSILILNISTDTVASMGTVEDSLIKAFKIKSSVGL
jgi:hypothetical protein